MKRTLTLIICLLLLQIVKAFPHFSPVSVPILKNSRLNNDFQNHPADTIIVPVVNQPAPLTSQSGIYKRRLDSIKKDIPLDYNEYVQSYIDIYMRNRDEMGHVLGLEHNFVASTYGRGSVMDYFAPRVQIRGRRPSSRRDSCR